MNHKISSIVVGAVLSALFTADAQANRACCSTDGTCKMVQERDQCANGEIQGRGVTCADNPCCEEALAALQQELAALQQELDQALADLQACQDNCGPVCGDDICECAEEDNCCEDCGCPSCESCVGGTCQSDCGDGTCDPACEDCNSCQTDCATTCGDGTCECGEDFDTCEEDCPCAGELQSCEDRLCCEGFECRQGFGLSCFPCPVAGDFCTIFSGCCPGLSCVIVDEEFFGVCE